MPFDPKDPATEAIVRDVRRVVASAMAKLKTGGRVVTDSEISATNYAYGRQVLEFAGEAGATLEEGGDAYKGISCSPVTFNTKAQRVHALGSLREFFAEAFDRATAEWNVARVDLGADITEVIAATEGIKAHPGVSPEVKEAVIAGSTGLYSLKAGRKTDRLAAAANTRNTNTVIASQQAESSAENASLKEEVQTLRIQNKFLNRGALQPEDVATDATAAASLRAPAANALKAQPAAPARRGLRRGPGRGPRRPRLDK